MVDTGVLLLPESMWQVHEQVATIFKANFKYFKSSIRILSKSIDDQACDAARYLLKEEILSGLDPQGGIIISGDVSHFYNLIREDGEHILFHFVFYKKSFVRLHVNGGGSDIVISNPTLPDTDVWQYLPSLLLSYLCFLNYAKVEDKVIMSNSKEGRGRLRNINETNTGVSFITSHYVTNLYVKGAFKVSGHWRLQPKKIDGKCTKELIWINQFMKNGYTRKAGMLNNQNA